jgi:hypothetical protein
MLMKRFASTSSNETLLSPGLGTESNAQLQKHEHVSCRSTTQGCRSLLAIWSSPRHRKAAKRNENVNVFIHAGKRRCSMTFRQHIVLIGICLAAWLLFLVLGIPSNYYLDYSPLVKLGIGVATLLFFMPPLTFYGLRWIKPDNYFTSSLVFCAYATLGPFVLDYLYCGLYQGYGLGFLKSHWLQTAGYIIFWAEMPVLGWMMQKRCASTN